MTSKATKRKMRELAGIAYEREMIREMTKLAEDFTAWQAGDIDVWELNDRIHQFHDYTARDLWKLYANRPDERISTMRGINYGVLTRDEIPDDVLEALPPVEFPDDEDE